MNPDAESKWEVLASREESSMASCWNEHLCIQHLGGGRFRLATCLNEWLDSIYSVVPEDQLYDDKGELRVPETYDGKRIVGLGDGEYLMTDELVSNQASPEFDAATMEVARQFCLENDWTSHQGSELAAKAMKRWAQSER